MLRLGAALIAAVLLTAQAPIPTQRPSEPPSPGRRNTQTEHQGATAQKSESAAGDKRGTKEAPLVIQIDQSQGHEAVATKAEEDGHWYASPDWWIAGLTGLLVLVTGGLWFFTGLLWSSTRKAVTVALQDFNAAHRPRLEVRFLRRSPDERHPGVEITVINTGDADARLIEGRAQFHWVSDDFVPSPHDIPAKYAFNIRTVFQPSAADRCTVPVEYGDDDAVFDNVFAELTGTKIMCLFGWLVYEGVQSPRRTTFFARVYDPKSRAFRDLPDYPDWNMIQ